ncbi:MAG: DUF167 domain-containing protein [Patescibacteria group bacterium]|jgi:hypothetical protein
MKIFVKAKPLARENCIEKIDENHFTVFVTDAPIKNRANLAIIKLLAKYFNVAPTCVTIISGRTSRQKVIEIQQI